MATTIINLLTSIDLDPKQIEKVQWGKPVPCDSIGIYFISTCSNPKSNSNPFDMAPIDDNLLNYWIKKVPNIQIDNKRAEISELHQRLSAFWLPDENILYIGQTESQGLGERINQYYNTELGDKRPHSGGFWIKTLSKLNQLFVHYLPVSNPVTKEKLLHAFVSQVSESTRNSLYDRTLPIPFANLELKNLELKKRKIKKHGISNARI